MAENQTVIVAAVLAISLVSGCAILENELDRSARKEAVRAIQDDRDTKAFDEAVRTVARDEVDRAISDWLAQWGGWLLGGGAGAAGLGGLAARVRRRNGPGVRNHEPDNRG